MDSILATDQVPIKKCRSGRPKFVHRRRSRAVGRWLRSFELLHSPPGDSCFFESKFVPLLSQSLFDPLSSATLSAHGISQRQRIASLLDSWTFVALLVPDLS